MTLEDIIDQVTPEIYQELQQVVATGKWLDGRKLTTEQAQLTLQAIIAYEDRYVDENHRTGVIHIDKNNACSNKLEDIDAKQSATFARFKTE